MKIDWFVKILLLPIAVSLAAIALRPYVAPPAASAQSGQPYPLYIEPDSAMLRAPEREQAGVWKSCAGPAQRQDLGVSHLHPRPLPGQCGQ